jgi:hypothetical protein
VPLRNVIEREFAISHWMELGAITGCLEIVEGHPRLLRSLDFHDNDYSGHIIGVLLRIIHKIARIWRVSNRKGSSRCPR